HGLPGVASPRILVVGLGESGRFDGQAYRKALRSAIHALRETPAQDAYLGLVDLEVPGHDRTWRLQQAVLVCAAGMYQYSATRKPRSYRLARMELPGQAGDAAVVARAQALNAGVEFTRELANLPPNLCTPAYMAAQAQALANELQGVTCEILDEQQMDALGMGALLAVARG